MSGEAPVDFVERQDWLEPIESGAQKAVAAAFRSAPEGGRHIRNFLHGTWLGHPVHAMLTDVPLGAWTATAVLDLMEASGRRDCRAGADITLAVGLTGAACAALAGVTDWQAIDGSARRVGVVHGMVNLASASLYTASLIARKRGNRGAGRAFAFAGFLASTAAAYLGGNLVYGKQIGVNHAPVEPRVTDWTDAMAEGDLEEGQPAVATVDGTKVLIVRSGGAIRCIAETCSHLGGPLSEGQIDGDTVQCPWHGSRFSLRDGSVIDGPTVHPQPSFETRVNQGRVEIKSREPR
jgi:nitrite reductase/ring-hydroxylating ferredoxin subunit/uncharacterized membrane protein